jgi:hypothetical protein
METTGLLALREEMRLPPPRPPVPPTPQVGTTPAPVATTTPAAVSDTPATPSTIRQLPAVVNKDRTSVAGRPPSSRSRMWPWMLLLLAACVAGVWWVLRMQ